MRPAFFFIVLSFAFGSCVYTTEPVSTGNFPGNISVILQANCMGGNCHSGPDSLNTELDLSSWEAMTKGSIYFNEIIPFSADYSHFFGHINTNQVLSAVYTPTMPLARDPLTQSDQMTFYNWIEQGAKSADGKIPYSNVAKKIFIVNQGAVDQGQDLISIIDADTKRFVRVIPVEKNYLPAAITMMPDLKSYIVAMAGANGVIRKYDAAGYGTISQFVSDLIPSEIALSPDGSKGYITDENSSGNRFGVFDPIGMKLIKTISSSLIEDPISVTVAPDSKYAYICGHGSDNIIRIDTRNDSVVSCLPLGSDVAVPFVPTYISRYNPQKAVITSDSKSMYVTCSYSGEVVAFDLMRDSITARIPIANVPWGEAISPDGSELWVVSLGSNAVHVISTSTNKELIEIDSISQYPHAITFTPDGAYAYIVCELSAGGEHHHATGGIAPSSFVIVDCKTRKIVDIEDLPAGAVGITDGYK